jgi:hypothetical protein
MTLKSDITERVIEMKNLADEVLTLVKQIDVPDDSTTVLRIVRT